ncbi:multicopper oxidase-domain-containing protein [Lasiosphaeria ovina]|uniref:Multicopper oxidase-domain-containing protein n=1 Tax=Lasiosphaeria ovina TaxID=92902 RepID=A0AAE0ND60_9PEZI|nr:multicopper oxidase-domain-containing protein [Lasiosphaeria ovina]
MKFASVWTGIVQVFNVATFSSLEDTEVTQIPLIPQEPEPGPVFRHLPITQDEDGNYWRGKVSLTQDWSSGQIYDARDYQVIPYHVDENNIVYSERAGPPNRGETPVIPTPKNPQDGSRINCRYPKMFGWRTCFNETKTCWLKNGTHTIDINTDYENIDLIPVGETKYYDFEVSEEPISPDGMTMEHGKLFNRRYPGPWIEACWGDTIEVNVRNKLRWNGTSVHWHGIRQFQSFQHDGVNGITECPIAPGQNFTYRFRATQYGSAWYHSHYSLQYGDGMLGPITIYGPSTAEYDDKEAFKPLLLTDWSHRSVFEDWPIMIKSATAPEMTNILINGIGEFGFGPKRDKLNLTLDSGNDHLLILINTAVDTTFVFSIDNHTMKVVEADFVPIVPYETDHIKIGIGQRYHVIVHGLDKPFAAERNGNYWMRVVPARKCSKFAFGPDEQMGIIRYNTSTQDPLSEPPLYDINCADEPYDKLRPYLNWTVGNPVNINATTNNTLLPSEKKYIFDVGMRPVGGPGKPPYMPNDKPYGRWEMHSAPHWANFSDPTVLALDRLPELEKEKYLNILDLDDEYEDKWVWMVITAPAKVPSDGERIFFPAAHPMHLHGHDFALLRQSSDNWYPDGDDDGDRIYYPPDKLNCANKNITCINPPRRDVVLLPAAGYIIVAFKADNPGTWAFHCHIAFHASSGLAMQIVENKHLIPGIVGKDKELLEEGCSTWDRWFSNDMNLWDWNHRDHFQDDSGV